MHTHTLTHTHLHTHAAETARGGSWSPCRLISTTSESCVWKELSPHRIQCPPRRQDTSIPESLYFLRGTLRLRQPHGVEDRAQSWELPDLDLGQLTFSFQTVSICAPGLGEGWGLLLDSLPRPREDGGGRILRSLWRARINCTQTLASDPTATQTVQGTRSSRLVQHRGYAHISTTQA